MSPLLCQRAQNVDVHNYSPIHIPIPSNIQLLTAMHDAYSSRCVDQVCKSILAIHQIHIMYLICMSTACLTVLRVPRIYCKVVLYSIHIPRYYVCKCCFQYLCTKIEPLHIFSEILVLKYRVSTVRVFCEKQFS